MKDLPIAARLYVWAVLAAGLIVLAMFAPHRLGDPPLFITLLVFSSLASALKVSLPLTKSGSSMSVSYAVDFAALLMLGADETMFVAGASAWSQCTFRMKTRNPLYRTLYSMASLVLTVKAAGMVYMWLGGTAPGTPFSLSSIPKPLVGAAMTYFVCNTAFIATAIGLSTRQPLANVWNDNFLWSAPSYFFGAGAAAVAAAVIERGGYWMALLTAGPRHMLSKPGRLTQEEFQKIRIHPQVGAEIISGVPFPYPVAPLILSHHERWDGKGYPAGLKSDEIPLGARILSVVDYFDALMSERPYHKAMSLDAAIGLLRQESGKALDPHIVQTFIDMYPMLQVEAEASQQPSRQLTRVAAQAPAAKPAVGLVTESSPHTNVFQDIALAHREIYALYEIAQAMGSSLALSD